MLQWVYDFIDLNVNSNDAGKSSMSSIDKSMNVGIVVVVLSFSE